MVHKLDEVFSDEEILQFLNNPESYVKGFDEDIRELFFQHITRLSGQPDIEKPPVTLANELVEKIFTGLAENSIQGRLLSLYNQWSDSVTYRESMQRYLHEFTIPEVLSCWDTHPDHCFTEVDRECFKDMGKNIHDKSYVKEKIATIQKRVSSKCTWCVPSWWREVITLILFNRGELDTLKSLDEIADYYCREYCTIDRAIRILYAEFLNDKELLLPWQELYENYNYLMLQKWFQYFSTYSQNQQGLLKELLKTNSGNTAIIVGDGIRLEIARGITDRLKKYYKIEEDYIKADIPSETENNMSALFLSNGMIEKQPQARRDGLVSDSGSEIVFMDLDNLNYNVIADNLVLNCPDIDSLGEKLQQNALKMFSELERNIAEKIQILAESGYKHIYLTTDHGFVLTGLLAESDKIEVDFRGDVKKNERYIRSVEKQTPSDQLLEMQKSYAQYNYIYFSKNHRPFKTTGKYGYSHGGITPQELIVPCFHIISSEEKEAKLSVSIQNKGELSAVVGSTFGVKIVASISENMFAQSRNIQVLILKDSVEHQKSDIFNVNAGESLSIEYNVPGNGTLNVILIDAETKELLDKTEIKINKSRDMGGLL